MMVTELCALILLIALCCAADADEPMFGMGRRHYLGEGRLDIEYTAELATPHVDWADPYVGGPVSAFVVPSVMEGRTLVELMQRLSMKVDAVTIDPAWDVNKWTMSFGEAYGARSEQNADGTVDYSFTYKYLEEDLLSDRSWEVMVMHGIVGWGHLPENVREAILRRVDDGMGLVLVGPQAAADAVGDLARLSPLTPAEAGKGAAGPRTSQWKPNTGAWHSEAQHYITAGVPLETLPSEHLGHGTYTSAPGAQVLAEAAGDPVVAVWEVGKGRVVALGYQNYGLAPYITWDAHGKVGDAWWETWYSLLIRSMLWAARKEPETQLGRVSLSSQEVSTEDESVLEASAAFAGPVPDDAAVAWQVRDDDGIVVASGQAVLDKGEASFSVAASELAGGGYLVDTFLTAGGRRVDWASNPLRVTAPVRLAGLLVSPAVVAEGESVRATASLTAPLPEGTSLTVELIDNYWRVLARDSAVLAKDRQTATCELASDDLLTHIGWVRATLRDGERELDRHQVRVALATPEQSRRWTDYEVNVPFYGPQNYYHWLPLLDEQYRRCGVTWLMEPERNFRFTVLAQPSGLGVYHYDRKPFDEQMEAYWRTGDRKYLERNPCLHGEWRDRARQQITDKISPYLKYRPFHYYIYDEPSLTSYSKAFEFCFTEETQADFRTWLRKQYGTLEQLNAEWGTSYGRWEQVEPVTADEARSKQQIPAWADFRHFMDITFADAFRYTQEVVTQLDPGSLTLVGGTQVPTPFNGTDWWLMSHSFGILEPYFGIDEFRSFNPDLPIIQACGYQDAGPEFEEELWRRALRGQKGATIFWNYTMLDPDLALNSQGLAMERAFGALRGDGIARLLLGARRDDSRIAILYSQMSLYAAWIQDGDVRSGRSRAARHHTRAHAAWQRLLHALGLQYRYISYEQLAGEGIDRRDFDLLVLPNTLSLSDRELEAIRAFTKAGGLVLSDVDAGVVDEHCKERPSPPLAGDRGVHVIEMATDDASDFIVSAKPRVESLLSEGGPEAPVSVHGASPGLVRYINGPAEYVALTDAPDGEHQIDFKRQAHIYDVRKRSYLGETDRVDVAAGNGRVALYAILPTRVEQIGVIPSGPARRGHPVTYQVQCQGGAAGFRHVFSVRVYGSDGRLRHMYGDNLDAPRAAATGTFTLALNDPIGEWRVLATDAATGVSGEASFMVQE